MDRARPGAPRRLGASFALAAVLAACATAPREATAPAAQAVEAEAPDASVETRPVASLDLASVQGDRAVFASKPRREDWTRLAIAAREGIAERATRLLDPSIRSEFDLVIYVSKAKAGPVAQHAFLLTRGEDGRLVPGRVWKVSTGREGRGETSKSGQKVNTDTPAGIFHFDLGRFTTLYRSRQWDADMPYAMFFSKPGRANHGGFAIHAAGSGAVGKLGRRASAGCIRLHPGKAKELYAELTSTYRGRMTRLAPGATPFSPVVSYDPLTGAKVTETGVRALLIVEDFDGSGLAAESAEAPAEAR